MNECLLPGFVEDLHFLWTHKPHLSQEISLFLTDLEQTKHGHFTGPGCRLISPDNSKRYLKYRRRFENFNFDSAYSEHCSLKLVDLIISEISMYWSVKNSQCCFI